jgi:hypothetical protein
MVLVILTNLLWYDVWYFVRLVSQNSGSFAGGIVEMEHS